MPFPRPPRKLLVIRFSAIGDIVLTTPVLRALKTAFPDCELHWLAKEKFAHVLAHNPHISRIHAWTKETNQQVMSSLRNEQFDGVLDLQGSLRSRRIGWQLGRPYVTFDKRNLRKWWMVRTKRGSVTHVVERYAQVLAPFGVSLDDSGLDFPLPEDAVAAARQAVQAFVSTLPPVTQPPVAAVLGATHNTKKWPLAYHAELLNRLGLPVVLIGGPAERNDADTLLPQLQVPVLDAVAHHDLFGSAALLQQCQFVITNDTGMMHIAAALQVPLLSIWGNTVPGFGMTPYRAKYLTLETIGLPCRPCSKIGFARCPQGHFRCMYDNTPARAMALLQQAGYLR